MKKVQLGGIFGEWIVLEKSSGKAHTSYLCHCRCGTERVVEGNSLTSGNSKSCGCKAFESTRDRLRKKPYGALYNKLEKQAAYFQKTFSLTYEEFLEFTKTETCKYCGGSVQWAKWARDKHSTGGYNLDRKDNSLGYSKNNCVVCCGDCNRTRGDRFSYEEFLLLSPILNLIRHLREVS